MKQILAAVFTLAVAFGQSQTPACPNAQLGGQQTLSIVSAGDYGISGNGVAPGSIVSMFAPNIATGVFVASDESPGALPTSLGSVSATITDTAGQTLPISFIAITQGQVNAVLPSGLMASQGLGTVSLTTSSGAKICGTFEFNTVAPSLFSADNTGGWLAAAQVVTTHSNGSQTFMDSIAQYSSTLVYNGSTWSHWIPIPIDLGSSTDVTVLELFGTGIRGVNSYAGAFAGPLVNVNPCILYTAADNSCDLMSDLTVLYAGSQGASEPGSFYGLDQINVVLPHSLVGSGMTVMEVTVVGYCGGCGGPGGLPFELLNANRVQVYIQ